MSIFGWEYTSGKRLRQDLTCYELRTKYHINLETKTPADQKILDIRELSFATREIKSSDFEGTLKGISTDAFIAKHSGVLVVVRDGTNKVLMSSPLDLTADDPTGAHSGYIGVVGLKDAFSFSSGGLVGAEFCVGGNDVCGDPDPIPSPVPTPSS
nr:hypothetical protein [Armatimonas sp.]